MRFRAFLLGIGAALAMAGTADAAWYNANWAYRTQLTINGALVPAAQTSFPVLVVWTADAKLAGGAQADGDDILFTAVDGTTKLDHEIESYTSATGALAAWVRVPALASGTNTTIYMYYGNAGVASQQNENGVWDANFRGVWHLVESPANAVAGHFDSTSDNFTGTPQGFADGTPGSTNAVGIVSGADSFLTDTYNVPPGNTVNRVEVPDNALLRPNGDMTVEAWINLLNPANGQYLVYKWDNGGGNFAYQLLVQNSAGSNYAAFQWLDSTGTIGPLVRGTTPLVAGTWYHVAGVRSGTTVSVYLNGNLEASSGGATGNIYATTPNFLVIGACMWGLGGLNGTEDEVRFSSSARSATWLKTEYNNLTNQGVGAGKFLLAGTSETLATTRVYYSVGTSRSVPTDLKSVVVPTITITGGVATFSVAQPTNVGVGDEIVYGGVTSYISGRLSSTQYTVTTRLGAPAADVGATTVTRIYRAFASLATAAANSGDASHLGTYDLVTGTIQLNLACYNDGVMTMADGAEVDIVGYTTGPATYIRVYTPVSASEVGVSQRHTGVFGTGFQLSGSNGDLIQIDDNYVRIEGLTILAAVSNNLAPWGGIWSVPNGPSDVRISHNIVKGNVADAAGRQAYGIAVGISAADVNRVWDNVVYNFPVVAGGYGVGISIDYGTAYLFNNTVYNCDQGIWKQNSAGAVVSQARNNVSINYALNTTHPFTDYGGFDPGDTRSNNVSSDTTSETVALRSKTAYATYFVNTVAGAEDLRLRNTSFTLWGSNGADLSADANLAVTDDIDGSPRVRPDIGADEFGSPLGPQMRVLSGTYVGDGALSGRPISVGFQPDLVVITSDSTNANVGTGYPSGHTAVLRTSTMVGNFSEAAYVYAYPPLVDRITSFTATGFTVGHPANHNAPNDDPADPYHCVNHSGVRYYWTAFKAAAGQMAVGTYTGNGAATQDITSVGFRPDYTIVVPANGDSPVERFALMPVDYSFDFDGGSQCVVGCPRTPGIRSELASGFRVGTYVNVNTVTYHYVAWKQTPGRISVGSYTGNGGNDRNITGTGFRPEFVTVSNGVTPVPTGSTVFKPASTGVATDYSAMYIAYQSTWQGPDMIQALLADGFQIGTDPQVNSSPDTYYYAAFGPHGATVNYRSIGPAANESTGTLTATNGSASLTGAGTLWKTRNRGRGDVITICDNPGGGCTINVDYVVASVGSDTSLRLTTPYAGTSGAGKTFVLKRQFAIPRNWVDCIDGPPNPYGGCTYFPVASSSLVADDRSEVGILYNDTTAYVFPVLGQPIAYIAGMTTDATHTVTLTVDPGNRHSGVAWSGSGATPHVVFNNAGNTDAAVRAETDFVTVEWLEVRDSGIGTKAGVSVCSGGCTASSGSVSSTVVVRNNVFHDLDMAVDLWGTSIIADVYDNLMYRCTRATRNEAIQTTDPSLIRILNNTSWGCTDGFHVGPNANGRVLLRNNIAAGVPANANFWLLGTVSSLSSHNLSQDATATAASAGGGAQPNTPLTGAGGVNFTSTTVGSENLHLQGSSQAIDRGADLSLAFWTDIDGAQRAAPWDIGADEFGAVTAVRLMSFAAVPGDSSVTLEWRTGSELDNLGFHLYRGPSAGGPWTRLTSSLIPGLGSSPLGQAYSWQDTGLVNGTRYFYLLEDVDTSSVSTFHGPLSAVPSPAGGGGGEGGDGDGAERGEGERGISSCPSWVLAAAPDAVSPVCTRHGDPESVSLQLLSRDGSSATLELRTGGFWALNGASGMVRVFVPGLEFPSDPKAPALPLRRALVDAVVGKGVELVSAEAYELQSFRGLRPSAVGARELAVGRDGTVRPARRSLAAPLPTRGYLPSESARLVGTVFQGEEKSAVVEMTPVRFSGSGLVLARRVRVKLAFTGEVEGESGTGSRGRAGPRRRALFPDVLARLHTSQRGLHAVGFEALFPDRPRGLSTRFLRLQRQGEGVAFHVEPAGPVFGPGSVLYFHADRTASSADYSSEVAYELVRSRDGSQMSVGRGTPAGPAVGSSTTGFASFETNRIYQPGLLEAEDVWLWQAATSTVAAPPAVAFSLNGVETASEEAARLVVHLQGGSESGVVADHHVRVLVNGVEVGEATFAGKKPYPLEAAVPASVLKEGTNELSVVNAGDTGVYSLAFLDRFELSYPQASLLRGGVFDGVWSEGGTVEVEGVTAPAVILRDPAQPGPEGSAITWLTGFEASGSSVRFRAEAGHRYLVVSREGLLTPRIGSIPPSTLKDRSSQADYLVIGPREFLEAAAPLLERRRAQGLSSRAVAFEEIASEFGHGQPSAEAIRAFLSYAYHSWRRPSPRYVLLLGDATYDPQHFLPTSWPSPLPALWEKTSYLWTASDPALAAVNGEDSLPDLAIGRLPATTREQAETLVSKVLAWEETGQGLSGNAVLVADAPDQGGDFEADVEDIRSSYLSDRATSTLKVRELGSEARTAILGAFDGGASLVSYVGHGGSAVWSSANVLNSWDAPSLLAQSRQPVLLTLNCLNGYFVAPNFDALPEALLKAEGRGVVAAVSPSGLSLDGPAHVYHRALMAELTNGAHERLGDAILAAQRDYAETGLMPELLTVYQLLGDPAVRMR
jgi:Peptidase family C25/Concanavalin A-like lectin/glucanases superfamily/Domain of unknown function (DUF2341)